MAPMKRNRDAAAKARDKPKRRRRVEGADPLFKFLGKLCGEECDEELVPVNGASSVGRSARKELRKSGREQQSGRQQPDSDEIEDRELDAIMMDMSDEDYEPPTRGGRDSKTGHGSSSSGRVAKQRQHKRLAAGGTGPNSAPETVTLSQGVQKAKRYICEALDFGVTSGYLTPKDAKGRILQVSPELLNTTSGGNSGAAGGTGAGSGAKSNAQTRRRRAAEEMDEEYDDDGEEEKSKKHKGSKKHRSRSSKAGGKKSGKSRSRSRSKRRSGKHGKKRIASRQQPDSEPNPNGHENEAEQDEMDDQVNVNGKTGQSSSSGGVGSNGSSGGGTNKNGNDNDDDDDNKSTKSSKSIKSTPNSESQTTNDESKKHHGDEDDNSNYEDDDDDESENKKGC